MNLKWRWLNRRWQGVVEFDLTISDEGEGRGSKSRFSLTQHLNRPLGMKPARLKSAGNMRMFPVTDTYISLGLSKWTLMWPASVVGVPEAQKFDLNPSQFL